MGLLEVLTPREVPLGGPRAMTVRRTLPHRRRTLIGAWCFVDHYGPDPVEATGGMRVPPHPHTGLQTVSWLFTGEIEHRDSAGNHALVRPGELNLMTAGRGISHSEVSTPATRTLHGVQLWVALPDGRRFTDPGFERHVPEPVVGDGFEARVFLGSALGSTSPVVTHTPLLGAEIVLAAGASLDVPLDPAFEHGVLVDAGDPTVTDTSGGERDGGPLAPGQLGYLAPGRTAVGLVAGSGPARVLLLGGPVFGEPILMWWNFVGRDHDEIARFRAEWQATVDGAARAAVDGAAHPDHGPFTLPDGDPLPPLPAPALPNGRLRPRA